MIVVQSLIPWCDECVALILGVLALVVLLTLSTPMLFCHKIIPARCFIGHM